MLLHDVISEKMEPLTKLSQLIQKFNQEITKNHDLINQFLSLKKEKYTKDSWYITLEIHFLIQFVICYIIR